MTAKMFPLLNLFEDLQRRNFPLGIQEYILLQEALAKGFGFGSRRELSSLCQILWAKSSEEAAQIENLMRTALPKELAPNELNELLNLIEESIAFPDTNGVFERDKLLKSSVIKETDAVDDLTDQEISPPNQEKYLEPQAAIRFDKGLESADINIPIPAIQTVPVNPHLDYIGQLPITKRQMKRAWRYYRRMQRIGAPTELDISATIKRIYQYGVLIQPVLISRRMNMARMLILLDEGGSMAPFRRVVKALVSSAGQSGLAKIGTFYFHDVAPKLLYRDSARTLPEAIEDVMSEFSNAGILIISDAGAARGNLDDRRVEQTGNMLKTLSRFSFNIAWLNPVPEARWSGTTAEAIRTEYSIPMFTFDRRGLDSAVEVLRGRGVKPHKC